MHALKEVGSGANLRGDEWEEHDGLVLFRGKVYVPLDTQLWHDIVEAHHDTLVTGHLGWWKTTELVGHNYWWPGMGHYIANTAGISMFKVSLNIDLYGKQTFLI